MGKDEEKRLKRRQEAQKDRERRHPSRKVKKETVQDAMKRKQEQDRIQAAKKARNQKKKSS